MAAAAEEAAAVSTTAAAPQAVTRGVEGAPLTPTPTSPQLPAPRLTTLHTTAAAATAAAEAGSGPAPSGTSVGGGTPERAPTVTANAPLEPTAAEPDSITSAHTRKITAGRAVAHTRRIGIAKTFREFYSGLFLFRTFLL